MLFLRSPEVAEVHWRARSPLLSLARMSLANPDLSPTRLGV